MRKYRNHKITTDGIPFDSMDEARYYMYLDKKKAAGEVLDYELQKKYILLDSFRSSEGKLIRAVTYTVDFLIYHIDGSIEAVDVKGYATQQGDLRRKLFMSRYPDIKLTWICRNLKYGDADGWIEYDALKKARKGKKE